MSLKFPATIRSKKTSLTKFFKKYKLRFIATFIATNIILFEILSFLAIYLIGIFAPQYRIDLFINKNFQSIDQQYLDNYKSKTYDQLLGWDYRPLSRQTFKNGLSQDWTVSYEADGSRESSLKNKPVLIASYGDSFVHGDEVDNNQTWQNFLSMIIDRQVKNFGVGGYGTDQVFLKLKRHMDQGLIAPVTILGIYESDVGRITSNFRPFINTTVGIKLGFKPAFRYENGKIRYIPNPFEPSMGLSELKSLATQISKDDPALAKRAYVKNQFPYLVQSLTLAEYFAGKLLNIFRGIDSADPWTYPQEKAVMEFLVDEFVGSSCRHNSMPVLLFIPDTQNWQDGRRLPKYLSFKKKVSGKYPSLIVVDIFDVGFDDQKFNLKPFRSHLSPYGNKIIAESIANHLKTIIDGKNPDDLHNEAQNYCHSLNFKN